MNYFAPFTVCNFEKIKLVKQTKKQPGGRRKGFVLGGEGLETLLSVFVAILKLQRYKNSPRLLLNLSLIW